MMRKSIVLLAMIVFLFPCIAGAGGVAEKDFEVQTTKNLLNLCTASVEDPLYHQAVNFCHGYLVGAFHYYQAEASGPEGIELVCFPEPAPSRNAAIDMFIEWAKTHPQYMGERPVETEFRFLMEKWPCKR